MITLKTILVPTDFGETSLVALTYARALAEAFDADLHLMHVLRDLYGQPWAAEAYQIPFDRLLPEMQLKARERLSGLVTDTERGRGRVEFVVPEVGSPFVEIIKYAKAHDIDLIVMGTHGYGPVTHTLLGSVAERVVRKAPCPVLTVRQPGHQFVMP